ncbi:DUF1622 domain-containing protein [Clostridium tarantellae]|uniref:DUF1622 domain-containing protein n=1 Tax=Clostridium tarantellae TaxID=39493 RepID=A0A6I1MW37_9CLOT|nr:DUF1622 domain-containing protein [Clostridium tarantellae]MPQ44389.1 DUF1622 domain-containing protein [Clostridium tarantellae]
MLEEIIQVGFPIIIQILEIMGAIVITVGALKAFYYYSLSVFNKYEYPIKFALANAMAMGLEFKLAAEILKTVLIRSFKEIAILGATILLRALLSFIIHMEIKSDGKTVKELHSTTEVLDEFNKK